MRSIYVAAIVAGIGALCGAPSSAKAVVFNFDDGTLQGWVNLETDAGIPLQFTVTNANISGLAAAHSGTYRVAPIDFNARDGAHEQLRISSPVIKLDGSGDLTLFMTGGEGAGQNQAVLPTNPSQLAPTTAGPGFQVMGVGVRRVSDNTYIATAQKATEGDPFLQVTIPAATLAPHVGTNVVVDVFDTFAGGWGWTGFDTVTVPGAVQSFTFNFDDGTLQGWTQVSGGGGVVLGPTQGSGGGPAATSGSFRIGPDPWGARDGAHNTLLVRSPEFILNTTTDLRLDMTGGEGAGDFQAVLPGSPNDLATTTGGPGAHVMGFGLRDVVTGNYVLTGQRTFNSESWETIVIPAATLAPFAGGRFTLDVFDSFAGGWGWIAFDSVVIPGTAPSAAAQVPEPASFGLIALSAAALLRRRARAA